jgi:uncharacterized protein (DUF305 family)
MTTSGRLAMVAGLLAVSACGSTTSGSVQSEPAPEGMTAAEIEALFEERTASARMRFTEADVAFVSDMIGHHAQALAMAALVPDRSKNQSIRTLAARVINAQRDEIATMETWLRDRGQRVPDVRIEGLTVIVDGSDHVHHMPGMVPPERMQELGRASGAEFDRLFLTLMIQHHRGAVTMVESLFATDGAAQDAEVFRIASDMQVDQRTEVARMQSMLVTLPGFDATP